MFQTIKYYTPTGFVRELPSTPNNVQKYHNYLRRRQHKNQLYQQHLEMMAEKNSFAERSKAMVNRILSNARNSSAIVNVQISNLDIDEASGSFSP